MKRVASPRCARIMQRTSMFEREVRAHSTPLGSEPGRAAGPKAAIRMLGGGSVHATAPRALCLPRGLPGPRTGTVLTRPLLHGACTDRLDQRGARGATGHTDGDSAAPGPIQEGGARHPLSPGRSGPRMRAASVRVRPPRTLGPPGAAAVPRPWRRSARQSRGPARPGPAPRVCPPWSRPGFPEPA